MLFGEQLILIRGAGDLATGVALRLQRAGFPVVMLELPAPLVVRRAVAFAETVRQGQLVVEGVSACLAGDSGTARQLAGSGTVAVMVDPEGRSISSLQPSVLLDARLAKRNIDTTIDDAPFVIALGPGFTAGKDVHAVVETMRGHGLGRVIWEGSALADTGTPGIIASKGAERVLRAPVTGYVEAERPLGDIVRKGELIARLLPIEACHEPAEVIAPFDGLLRGLVASDVRVKKGMKIGDLDPRLDTDFHRVSDKALAIGGGVLEAILTWLNRQEGKSKQGGAPWAG